MAVTKQNIAEQWERCANLYKKPDSTFEDMLTKLEDFCTSFSDVPDVVAEFLNTKQGKDFFEGICYCIKRINLAIEKHVQDCQPIIAQYPTDSGSHYIPSETIQSWNKAMEAYYIRMPELRDLKRENFENSAAFRSAHRQAMEKSKKDWDTRLENLVQKFGALEATLPLRSIVDRFEAVDKKRNEEMPSIFFSKRHKTSTNIHRKDQLAFLSAIANFISQNIKEYDAASSKLVVLGALWILREQLKEKEQTGITGTWGSDLYAYINNELTRLGVDKDKPDLHAVIACEKVMNNLPEVKPLVLNETIERVKSAALEDKYLKKFLNKLTDADKQVLLDSKMNTTPKELQGLKNLSMREIENYNKALKKHGLSLGGDGGLSRITGFPIIIIQMFDRDKFKALVASVSDFPKPNGNRP